MPTTHLEIVRANYARRSDIQGELRQIDEAATTDQRGYTDDESGRINELRSELEAIDGRIQANIETELRSQAIDNGIAGLLGALVDRESGQVHDTRSMGEQFAHNEAVRAWIDAGARGNSPGVDFHLPLNAVTDTTTGATSGGAFMVPDRLDRVGQDFLDRRVFLSDLLPTIQVSTGSVEYVQDKSPLADMANKAVEVAEAGAKPQAGITLEVVTEAPATIAAWANITRQVAADAPQVVGYLDGRLRYSLKRRTDGQIINGNGTSPNISGLLDRSGINAYTAPAGSEATYASIRKAITLMEQDDAVPEIVVLNPADAELFDLSNATSAGLHAVPNLTGPSATTAWGLTQVRSNAVASGTALLIDPMAVAILDRQQATAYMTDSHASLFISNILTLLLECRVGLALFDPAGVCSVTFDYTP